MLRKILISLLLASFAFALVPVGVLADMPQLIGGTILPGADDETKGTIAPNVTEWMQGTFLRNLIDQAIGWTAALAVIFLIIGGYQYLTAMGNEEQLKVAHKTIIWSIAGVLLALLSFAIVQIIVNIQFEVPAANLLAAKTADILPFAETNWDKVPEVKALPQADFKEQFLPIVAQFLIYAMAFIATFVISFAGATLVNGWGDEAAVKKAKNAIIWGITGLAFAAASYIIVKGVLMLDFSTPATAAADGTGLLDMLGDVWDSVTDFLSF
ncbi:MAG: hypothetical protein WCV72_02520 [Patescibacteria group bacterium]